jgi:hypothetical protein
MALMNKITHATSAMVKILFIGAEYSIWRIGPKTGLWGGSGGIRPFG